MANTKPIPLKDLRGSPRRRLASIDKTLVGVPPAPSADHGPVASLKKTLVGIPSEEPRRRLASEKKTLVGGIAPPPSRRFASTAKTWVGPGDRAAMAPMGDALDDDGGRTLEREPLPDAFRAGRFVEHEPTFHPLPPTAARYRRVAYAFLGVMGVLLVVAAASATMRAHERRADVTNAPLAPNPTPPSTATPSDTSGAASPSPPAAPAAVDGTAPATNDTAAANAPPPSAPTVEKKATKHHATTARRTSTAPRARSSSPSYGAAATPVLAPFDRSAAAASLAQVSRDSVLCNRTGTPQATRISVTFAPDGRVVSAKSLDGSSIGSCVAQNASKARVPPFRGQPMTITTVIAP